MSKTIITKCDLCKAEVRTSEREIYINSTISDYGSDRKETLQYKFDVCKECLEIYEPIARKHLRALADEFKKEIEHPY